MKAKYVYDVVGRKFTAKKRDNETGLDYFNARYFSAPLGRFTSPDPLMASGRTSNPQTWNRYTYTLNNPLRYTDPLGLYESPIYDDDCDDTTAACLNSEQRRIQQKSGGKSFWRSLFTKNQNAFVNTTNALDSVTFEDGKTALNLIQNVTKVGEDRIFGNADPRLMQEISKSPLFDSADGSLHGKYSTSFKSNNNFMGPGNLQISFASDGMSFDIDIDLYRNPALHFFGEVVPNHTIGGINRVFGTNLPTTTNQDAVRRMLIANPSIGITPSPDVNPKFNR